MKRRRIRAKGLKVREKRKEELIWPGGEHSELRGEVSTDTCEWEFFQPLSGEESLRNLLGKHSCLVWRRAFHIETGREH